MAAVHKKVSARGHDPLWMQACLVFAFVDHAFTTLEKGEVLWLLNLRRVNITRTEMSQHVNGLSLLDYISNTLYSFTYSLAKETENHM